MVSTGRDVNWETAWSPVYIAMVNMYFAQLLHFVLLHHCPAATAFTGYVSASSDGEEGEAKCSHEHASSKYLLGNS